MTTLFFFALFVLILSVAGYKANQDHPRNLQITFWFLILDAGLWTWLFYLLIHR